MGNVAELVAKLGGEELYGPDSSVPLRELTQNSCDAIRARRLLEDWPSDRGEIRISVQKEITDGRAAYSITVADDGVGMSEAVLVGELIDFGSSLWRSSGIQREFPGLIGKGFESTGKYGIGFFSLFMWGDRIRITTRRFDEAPAETRILEFYGGLGARPILHRAEQDEVLADAGTCVKVWLRESPYSMGRLLGDLYGERLSLVDVCASLCVASPVTISIREEDGEWVSAVKANDWKTISGRDLLKRVCFGEVESYRAELADTIEKFGANVRDLTDDRGAVVGRACIVPYHHRITASVMGSVTAGGLRASKMQFIGGVLVGQTLRASRDVALPVANGRRLSAWASGQAGLIRNVIDNWHTLNELARIVRFLGGDTGGLPIGETRNGWLTALQLRDFAKTKREILIADSVAIPLHCSGSAFQTGRGRSEPSPARQRRPSLSRWLSRPLASGMPCRVRLTTWTVSLENPIKSRATNTILKPASCTMARVAGSAPIPCREQATNTYMPIIIR